MRSRLVLGIVVASTILAAGCTNSNNKGKLERTTWVSLAQNADEQNLPEGHLKLTFDADRKFTYQLGDSTLNGTYSIGSEDRVTFFYAKPVAKKTKHIYTIKIRNLEMEFGDEQGRVRKFRKAT